MNKYLLTSLSQAVLSLESVHVEADQITTINTDKIVN